MNSIISSVYHFVYSLPLYLIIALVIILFVFWRKIPKTKIGRQLHLRQLWKPMCRVLFFLWLMIVIYTTLLSRDVRLTQASLEPFYQLKVVFAGGSKELIRSLVMNVFLFVPGGLLLGEVIRKHKLHIIIVFLLLTGISICIEMLQLYWQVGLAETDDVICNAIGAILGALVSKTTESKS